MYSLDCEYYKKEFPTLELLIEDILATGMDPNYEVTWNGLRTGEIAADFIIH